MATTNAISQTLGQVVVSPTAPSANQVLTASSGTAASWATPASGSTPQHFYVIDGRESSVATRFDASKNILNGTIAMGTNNNWLEFRTSATASSYAKVRSHNNSLGYTNSYTTAPSYWSQVLRSAGSFGTGNVTFGVGGFDMTASGNVQSFSAYSNYLIKMVVAGASFTNSYTQSDGSTATTATITIASPGVFNTYTALLTASNVKYYLNKTLLATVTTTLPGSDNTAIVMGTGNNATANNVGFDYYEGVHSFDAF